MIGKLSHLTIAALDLGKASAIYRDVLGAKVSLPVDQPEHGAITIFVDPSSSRIKLLAPLEGPPLYLKDFVATLIELEQA